MLKQSDGVGIVGASVQASPASVPRRYVSLFRIDGVPILPPLMTSEKRLQMQKLKEKALKIEERCKRRIRHSDAIVHNNNVTTPQSSPKALGGGSGCDSSSDCNTSQPSVEFEVQRMKCEQELHESYALLSDLMQSREATPPTMESHDVVAVASSSTLADDLSSLVQSSESNLAERMQKLAKSETIIYDNRANTIIMPMRASDYQRQLHHTLDEAEQANLSQSMSPKSIHLTAKQIPSICVDPPTPIVDGRSFCSSHHSQYADELSSDESFTFTSHRSDIIQSTTPMLAQSSPRSDSQHTYRGDVKAPPRSVTSPQLKLQAQHGSTCSMNYVPHGSYSENPLVRSNSFTLACPSKVLLEHIRKQKDASAQHRRTTFSVSATRDTVESKAKRVQKVDLKSRAPMRGSGCSSGSSQRKTNVGSHIHCGTSHSTALVFKNKRSPYETKSCGKSKSGKTLRKNTSSSCSSTNQTSSNIYNNNNKKQKTLTANNKLTNPTISTSPAHPTLRHANLENNDFGESLLNQFESEHHQKLLHLITQQQEEQKRMQAAFEAQQQEMLAQLSIEINNMHFPNRKHNCLGNTESEKSLNTKSDCSEYKSPTGNSTAHSNGPQIDAKDMELASLVSNITPVADTNIVTTTNCSMPPRRRLFGLEEPPELDVLSVSAVSTSQPQPNRCTNRRSLEVIAATIINAYARGFLVRRLFQTEQIQRIVQTIRDTLIFVLNLHVETLQNANVVDTPANIKLKARLLQQLSSATRTLHLVFFQTTVKERMDIIARDRKRIKTKLMALNLKR